MEAPAPFKLKALQALARVTRRIKFPGNRRLVWSIYNPDAHPDDHFKSVVRLKDDLLIHTDISSFLDWCLFFFGEYQPQLSRAIRRIVKPGFVCFDVGANIGCYTLVMSRLARGSGKIFAFEPQPGILERLKKNIRLNGLENITPLPFALSDKSGKSSFYSPLESTTNLGEASFYKENVTHAHVEIQVNVKTLDEIVSDERCGRVDFLKIDTEGNEYKTLLGGIETLKKHRPSVIFEYDARTWKNAGCDFKTARNFFEEMNYRLSVILPNRFAKIDEELPVSADILAVPRALN